MNKQFLTLFLAEFKNQIKLNNLIKYLFLFIAFCTLSVTFISSHQDIQEFGIIFAVICVPLAQLNISTNLFKQDVADGTIESLSTVFSAGHIALAKFGCLAICSVIAFIANIPILAFLYNIDLNLLFVVLFCGILLSISSSAIMCLIAAVQSYFRSNTNFLSVLVMPIIIPNIILTGLALQNSTTVTYLAILLGTCMILTPIALFLSKYLIENIYNI